MDLIGLGAGIAELILAALIGREGLVIMMKQRQMSIEAGLDWPWEWADSTIFRIWTLGLGFLWFILVLVLSAFFDFAFSLGIGLLGFTMGFPIGYLTRNYWKIDTSPPRMEGQDSYNDD